MRSSVTLKEFMYSIRHETNEPNPSEEFPNELLFEWIHQDICETVLRLGGLINQLYRKISGNLAIASAAAGFHTTISHGSGETSVTGFSGLTPDAWIGGAIMAEDGGVLYSAQITDNDATTVTISVGTDLPVLSSVTVLLTNNDAGQYASMSSLSMIHFPEPIWQVLDGSGNPIEPITLEKARNIVGDPNYDGKVFWYLVGENLRLALGDGASISGNLTVGYYELPTKATALTNQIDFPLEYHDLVKQRVMVRILKKKGEYSKAREKEVDLNSRLADIDRKNMEAFQLDRITGERA